MRSVDFKKTIFATMSNSEAIEWMQKLKYKQISRKYKAVARVDIPLKEMQANFIKDNFGDSSSGIPSCPLGQQEDHYRRCYSNDSMDNVPENILAKLR